MKHFGIYLVIVLFYIYLAWLLPLTSDEIHNFVHIASKNPFTILTNYEYPNNHIFHTLLVWFIGVFKIYLIHPHTIRIVSVISTAVLLLLILKILKVSKITHILWIVITFITFSPYIYVYSVMSRGYILGTLLVLFSILLIDYRRIIASGFVFVLSLYTIPTFAYGLPGLWLILYLKYGKRPLILHIIVTSIISIIVYLPILKSLLLHVGSGWNNESLFNFIYQMTNSYSFNSELSIISIFAVILVFMCVYYSIVFNKLSSKENLSLYLLSYCVSYFVIVGTLYALGINPPFTRNGIIIFVFNYIIIQLYVANNLKYKNLIIIFLLCNTIINSILIYKYVFYHIPLPVLTKLFSLPISSNSYNLLNSRSCLLYNYQIQTETVEFLSTYYHFSYGYNSVENIRRCCSEYNQLDTNNKFITNNTIVICSSKLNIPVNLNETVVPIANPISHNKIINVDKWLFTDRQVQFNRNSIHKVRNELFIEQIVYKSLKKIITWLINPSPFDPELLIKLLLDDSNRKYYLSVKNINSMHNIEIEKYLLTAEDNMTLITKGISYYLKSGIINSSLVYEIYDSLLEHEAILLILSNEYADKQFVAQLKEHYIMNKNTILEMLSRLEPNN